MKEQNNNYSNNDDDGDDDNDDDDDDHNDSDNRTQVINTFIYSRFEILNNNWVYIVGRVKNIFAWVETGCTVAQKGRTCKLKMLLRIKNSTCKLKIVHAN